MFSKEAIFGLVLISQMCLGVTGNSLLFVVLIYTFLTRPDLKKPIDYIVLHLTLINAMTIMFALIPYITSSFGVRKLLDDAGCKAVLYIYRVTRGLSICTTSLLSALQATTISPVNSKWARLKLKLTTSIFRLFLFFWIINMLIYIRVIEAVRAIGNVTLVGHGYYHIYCQSQPVFKQISTMFATVILTHDLLFVGFMVWTSLYMMSLLVRHRRRARHIRSQTLSSQPSPEHQATHSILLLVSCFVFFYFSNDFLTIYSFYMPEKGTMFEGISTLLSSCYSTFSPFVLLKHNKIIAQLTSSNIVMRCICPQRVLSG